jgi:hypothetical protein
MHTQEVIERMLEYMTAEQIATMAMDYQADLARVETAHQKMRDQVGRIRDGVE